MGWFCPSTRSLEQFAEAIDCAGTERGRSWQPCGFRTIFIAPFLGRLYWSLIAVEKFLWPLPLSVEQPLILVKLLGTCAPTTVGADQAVISWFVPHLKRKLQILGQGQVMCIRAFLRWLCMTYSYSHCKALQIRKLYISFETNAWNCATVRMNCRCKNV